MRRWLTGVALLVSAVAAHAQAFTPVRGTVTAVTDRAVTVQTERGSAMTVTVTPALQIFSRVPSDLSHVMERAYVGVTSTKQSDGTERASEVQIFPEEMRGTGEGSRLMGGVAPIRIGGPGGVLGGQRSMSTSATAEGVAAGAGGAAMTGQRMTNGSAHVAGATLTVSYMGGTMIFAVPADAKVVEVKEVGGKLRVGDVVAGQGHGEGSGVTVLDTVTVSR